MFFQQNKVSLPYYRNKCTLSRSFTASYALSPYALGATRERAKRPFIHFTERKTMLTAFGPHIHMGPFTYYSF